MSSQDRIAVVKVKFVDKRKDKIYSGAQWVANDKYEGFLKTGHKTSEVDELEYTTMRVEEFNNWVNE